MENEITDAVGDDSLDSIPRPEYETIESIKDEVKQDFVGAILKTENKEFETSSSGILLQSATSISQIQNVIPMDHDYNESVEGLNKIIDDNTLLQNDTNLTETAAVKIAMTDAKNSPHQIVSKIQISTSSSTHPKLVQAKTKDNKVVLVQLVDENGKTFRSPNKSTMTLTSNSDEEKQMRSAQQQQQPQPRSVTPMSREYLALQKSVNESKILTEFVTDTSNEKARKRKPTTATAKDISPSRAINKSSSTISTDIEQDSFSKFTTSNDSIAKQRRKSNSSGKFISIEDHITADSPTPQSSTALSINDKNIENNSLNTTIKLETSTANLDLTQSNWILKDTSATNLTPHKHGEKVRKSSKFMPLKDESNQSYSSNNINRRSRSKSVNRKSSPFVDLLHSTPCKMKKWPSEEKISKRSNMRSQNSEFVQKQIDFLNRVNHHDNDNEDDDEGTDNEEQHSTIDFTEADALSQVTENETIPKDAVSVDLSLPDIGSEKQLGQRKLSNTSDVETQALEKYLEKIWSPPPKENSDSFCWKCRQSSNLIPCFKCVRSFHPTCVKVTAAAKLDQNWICPECLAVENVLNGHKKTRRNEFSLDLLSQLLNFALKRMRIVKGLSQFQKTLKDIPNLQKYFVNPVTFSSLQEKIEKKTFRCAEEFVSETKWLNHNALLAACGTNSKDSSTAKAVLKICRQEAIEIDTCAECYLNANTRSDWFVDVCSQPHLLLWAKLKGFPYWPAKAMGLGQGAHVNVRFFGEHDRAYVPSKDCYLFSEHVPNAPTRKSSRAGFAECLNEVQLHIEKIKQKIGDFKYAPYKTLYEPAMEMQQLEMMMPGVQDYIKKQQSIMSPKPPLQYKIVKNADNHLSIIKKTNATDSGTESDHSLGMNVTVVVPKIDTVTVGIPIVNVATCSPGKKKLIENLESAVPMSTEHGKTNKNIVTPNYEVISKITNDKNKSSKLSTVILKRKADQISGSKSKSDDLADMHLPKMTKIEENATTEASEQPQHQVEGATDNSKRVGEKTIQDSEANKIKHHHHHHSKPDPKIPILTIKTNVNTKANTNSNADATKIAEIKEVNGNTGNKTTPDAQNNVENLVKFKQGVTIKKINKEDVQKKPLEAKTTMIGKPKEAQQQNLDNANLNNDALTPDEKSKKNELNKNKKTQSQNKNENQNKITDVPSCSNILEMQNKNQNQNQNQLKKSDAVCSNNSSSNITETAQTPQQLQLQKEKLILKDLVPFVEIKKEVTSDDENNVGIVTQPKSVSLQDKIIPHNPVQPPPSITTPVNITAEQQVQPAFEAASSSIVLLNTVKQEVMSDNEDDFQNIAQSIAEKPSIAAVEKLNPPPVGDSLRVGDTTIQRISTKSTPTAITVTATNSTLHCNTIIQQQAQNLQIAPPPLTGTIYTSLSHAPNTNTTILSKRSTVRGIPYGPLPASASSAGTKMNLTNVEQNPHANLNLASAVEKQLLQQQQLHQQLRQSQRARKSFPNRSPPEVSPVRCIATPLLQISPIASPAAVTTTATSTATVPAGLVNVVDAKRALTKTSMVSIPVDIATSRSNSTIPVPPLTAVTKIPPTITTVNSVVATVMPATTACMASNALINSNGATIGNGGAIASPAPQTINVSTALTMSVPPPLAGLSYHSFSDASSMNSVAVASTAVSTTLTSPLSSSSVHMVGNAQAPTSDAAFLNNSTLPAATTVESNAADTHLLGNFVTPSLASAITEVICRGPPRMAARPSGPLQSDGSTMFPSQAGPVCRTLVENAHKLTDFFISVMEDTMCEMSVGDDSILQAKITLLTMELERTKQTYEREIAELKRTSDLMLCEMRKSMDNEKARIAADVRKQCELERIRSVEEAKKKQWCANCGREAQFYCCWNTSYCDYPCQQLHWGRHATNCAQTRPNDILPSNSSISCGTGGTNSAATANQLENSTIQQRQYGNTKSVTSSPTTHYNSKTVISNKKDKSNTKSGNMMNNALTPSTASPEVLKLPSNTYLRPVANANNTNVRTSSYPTQMPVQRFNIPLPIAAPANPGLPYTLVQREGNWELMSAATSTQTTSPSSTIAVTNASSVTMHQQQSQQTRLISSSNALSKSSPRNRVGCSNNSVTVQTLNPNMNTAAATLRPTTHM